MVILDSWTNVCFLPQDGVLDPAVPNPSEPHLFLRSAK